jgi:hypothetical protein
VEWLRGAQDRVGNGCAALKTNADTVIHGVVDHPATSS